MCSMSGSGGSLESLPLLKAIESTTVPQFFRAVSPRERVATPDWRVSPSSTSVSVGVTIEAEVRTAGDLLAYLQSRSGKFAIDYRSDLE